MVSGVEGIRRRCWEFKVLDIQVLGCFVSLCRVFVTRCLRGKIGGNL